MTFISFAQNYEDVILWRALKRVQNGFYIDVGAADPDEDSVSRSFYGCGWHGINIEPEPGYANSLRERRPRDINIELALGHEPGRTNMFIFGGTGLSTFDRDLALQHEAAGFGKPLVREIEIATLASVCAEHAPADIHFLKIDVEGSERDVLAGADLWKYRPWIIVVEATAPTTSTKTVAHFEDLLLTADYRFRLFDGLNAFYIAAERDDELRQWFELPPNVFDGFITAKMLDQVGRADQAEAARDFYAGKLEEVRVAAEANASESARLRSELEQARSEFRSALSDREAAIVDREAAILDRVAAIVDRDSQLRHASEHVAMLERHIADLGRMNASLAQMNATLTAETRNLSGLEAALKASREELDRSVINAAALREQVQVLLDSTPSWGLRSFLRRARPLVGR